MPWLMQAQACNSLATVRCCRVAHDWLACCRLVKFPVGILTPDWLANATYLGTETVDAKPCHVWTKAGGFIKYWADQDSGDPVRWIFFDGMQVRTSPDQPYLARGKCMRCHDGRHALAIR